MTEHIASVERVVSNLEAAQFGTSVASGFRLASTIVRQHQAYADALAVLVNNRALALPILLDRVAQYIKMDPRPYEHPNDQTVFSFLLLVEDVFGAESTELRVMAAAAEQLPSPWWIRHFIERMRAASQSGA